MNAVCSFLKIGEILLKQNKITVEQLNEVLKLQILSGKKTGELLIEKNYINEITLLNALSKQLEIEVVNLDNYYADSDAVKLLTENTAKRTCSIPLKVWNDRILVAMDDPLNIFYINDIEAETNRTVETVIAPKSQIIFSNE